MVIETEKFWIRIWIETPIVVAVSFRVVSFAVYLVTVCGA